MVHNHNFKKKFIYYIKIMAVFKSVTQFSLLMQNLFFNSNKNE